MIANNKINNFQILPYFNLREFACPCCNTVKLHKDLADNILALRFILHKPIVITSAYRCTKHNERVGGVSNSQHLRGTAVDCSLIGHDPKSFTEMAGFIGFREVIMYSGYSMCHLGLYEK